MTEITLEANHCWIDTTPQNLATNFGSYGIYILGIKNSNGVIVPYYVGKSESSISKRVEQHLIAITSPSTTYTIFSDYFFASRGVLPDFIVRKPQPYTKKCYPSSEFGKSILYLNKDYFFRHLVGHHVSQIDGQWPLNELSSYGKSQNFYNQAIEVQTKIFCPGSLYFTCILPNIVLKGSPTKGQQILLECMETYAKFSLKVNTIGKSQSLETMRKNLNGISLSLNIQGIHCGDLRNEFYSMPQ